MNLIDIVKIYSGKFQPNLKAQLDWFRRQPSLFSTIENASLARNSAGKRYSHQRRIKRTALHQAKTILLANIVLIEKAKNFDGLISLIDELVISVHGIGELYIYDTSLRIGSYLGLLPAYVYLHSGTRVGAKQLGLHAQSKYIEKSLLPKELMQLEPHEIEDVLCIFKSKLS